MRTISTEDRNRNSFLRDDVERRENEQSEYLESFGADNIIVGPWRLELFSRSMAGLPWDADSAIGRRLELTGKLAQQPKVPANHVAGPDTYLARKVTEHLGGDWHGTNGTAPGPGHSKQDRSLKISPHETDHDDIILHSFAGDDWKDIKDGLRAKGILPDKEKRKKGTKRQQLGPITASYDYVDESSTLLFQVCRYEPKGEPKTFLQRRPDGNGGWIWNVKGIHVVPYNLPQVLKAIEQKQIVFIPEGEKDCNNLAKLGLVATCNAGGAGKWKPKHAAYLAGADVVVLPDNDEPGHAHAEAVAKSLKGTAARIRVLELRGLREKGDVSDWLAKGGTKEQLLELAEEVPEWTPVESVNGGAKPLTVIDRLNRDHALVMLNGQSAIINRVDKGKFTYSRKEDFFDWYANEFIQINDEPMPVAKYWFKNKDRRQYKGVEFAIGNPTPGFFNLWEGFAVEPAESGCCDLFFTYVLDVVCSGDAKLYDWVVSWLAHIVQRPEDKGDVAVVLRGLRGAGKTILGDIFKRLLPSNAIILSSPDELLGAFNAHLQSALFVQVEEAFWAGDKRAEGKLKTLISSPTIGIQPKFINRFEVRNYSRFLITSNEDWCIPAGFHERRFTVIDVSNAHMQDHAYFAAILAQLDKGGYGRLMWELRHHDLKGFNPRQHYHTEALEDQIREGLGPLERFLCALLEGQGLPDVTCEPWSESGYGQRVDCETFFKEYSQFEKQYSKYPLDPRAFGTRLKKLINCKRKRGTAGNRKWGYEFNDLDECRVTFEKNSSIKLDEVETDDPF